MRDLRAPYLVKTLATGLMLSLLLAVIAPLLHAQKSSNDTTFSDWLRSQVPVEHDDQFQEALVAAEAQHAEHLTDFIRAFVDAHPAPEKLADALSDNADGDLFALLTTSSEKLGSAGVFPRFIASVSVNPLTLDRLSVGPAIILPALVQATSALTLDKVEAGELLVYAFSLFSNAQPLGP